MAESCPKLKRTLAGICAALALASCTKAGAKDHGLHEGANVTTTMVAPNHAHTTYDTFFGQRTLDSTCNGDKLTITMPDGSTEVILPKEQIGAGTNSESGAPPFPCSDGNLSNDNPDDITQILFEEGFLSYPVR